MQLTQVHRQSDMKFINILQAIRLGKCTPNVTTILKSTSKHRVGGEGIIATRLCTHQQDVQEVNKHHLEKLPGKPWTFRSEDSDPSYTTYLDSNCPVSSNLVLKVGAQVTLTKNLDIYGGLVNGARGVVQSFDLDGFPLIHFACGRTESIRPKLLVMKVTGGVQISRKQLPLKLAWALSIHKSQGMTLDCVELSLAKVFEAGQAYVALSRAKSFNSLKVLDFEAKHVHAHPAVLRFYSEMKNYASEYSS